jgi:hypothetical protein
MSLLTIITNVCRRVGQPVPNVVVSSTDATVQQMLSFANEQGTALMKYGDWRKLRRTKEYTTLAQEAQTGMIPSDLGQWIDESAWNRSARRPLFGPISPQQWQAWKAFDSFPVIDVWYMEGDDILVQPVPEAGETFAFAYTSNQWCKSATGTGQSEWLADTDVGVLSERIMTLAILARYLEARGLSADAAWRDYDMQCRQELSQDSPRSTHSFSGGDYWWARRPGILVPDGSWPVSN